MYSETPLLFRPSIEQNFCISRSSAGSQLIEQVTHFFFAFGMYEHLTTVVNGGNSFLVMFSNSHLFTSEKLLTVRITMSRKLPSEKKVRPVSVGLSHEERAEIQEYLNAVAASTSTKKTLSQYIRELAEADRSNRLRALKKKKS